MSTKLGLLDKRWLNKFDELDRGKKLKVAPPYFSVKPQGYDPGKIPSILYVGKATAKEWFLPQFKQKPNARFLRKKNREYIAENNGSAFWQLARLLSEAVAEKTGHKIQPLQNLVVTNLCKIGELKGKPTTSLCQVQSKLAVETLCWEIGHYKPRLIFFATGDDGDVILEKALQNFFNVSSGDLWDRSGPEHKCWYRRARERMPAVYWGPHPVRKKRSDVSKWVREAVSLLKSRSGKSS